MCFQFLDLPTELRLSIYELAFATTTVTKINKFEYAPHGLVFANKQIHTEALSLFYKETAFYFPNGVDWQWYNNMSPRIRGVISCIRPSMKLFERSEVVEKLQNCRRVLNGAGVPLKTGVYQLAVLEDDIVVWVSEVGNVEAEDWSEELAERFQRWAYLGGMKAK